MRRTTSSLHVVGVCQRGEVQERGLSFRGVSRQASPTINSPGCARTRLSTGTPESDGPGYWAITRHNDLRALSRNHEVFSKHPPDRREKRNAKPLRASRISDGKGGHRISPPGGSMFGSPTSSSAWASDRRPGELARQAERRGTSGSDRSPDRCGTRRLARALGVRVWSSTLGASRRPAEGTSREVRKRACVRGTERVDTDRPPPPGPPPGVRAKSGGRHRAAPRTRRPG